MGHNKLGDEVRASVNVAYVAQMIAVGAVARMVACVVCSRGAFLCSSHLGGVSPIAGCMCAQALPLPLSCCALHPRVLASSPSQQQRETG